MIRLDVKVIYMYICGFFARHDTSFFYVYFYREIASGGPAIS